MTPGELVLRENMGVVTVKCFDVVVARILLVGGSQQPSSNQQMPEKPFHVLMNQHLRPNSRLV